MNFRSTLLASAAALAALTAAARAEPVTGFYIGAGAGGNLWHDQKSNGLLVHDRDLGGVGLASFGWGYGNGLRAEIEGDYRYSKVETLSLNHARIGGFGHIATYGAMANAFYDFNTGSRFMPYVGAGLGYAWTELNSVRGNVAGSRLVIDQTKGNLGYQAILGAAYDLGGGVALTAEYRYFGALESTYRVTSTPANATLPGQFKSASENHSFLLGIRYAFNAAPAAAAMAPATAAPPAIARTYLVFFDWDKANLTERAKQIIAEAAGAAHKTETTRIEVAGHADRSGTPAYNLGLSRRRADAVAAELVRQGIAKTEIAISYYGETRPLVPTADGVREPQNRRVEIVLK